MKKSLDGLFRNKMKEILGIRPKMHSYDKDNGKKEIRITVQ